MNDFFTLMSHPITIIATLLALFFVAMALLRRSSKREESVPATDPKSGTIRVTSPYAPPAAPPSHAAFPSRAPSLGTTSEAARTFRQFGPHQSAPGNTVADGYLWE